MLLASGAVSAAEIQVAVASNFAITMKSVAAKFEANTGHSVVLISGSSGKHFAQINNGAPYDVFFSADQLRPELLEKNGTAVGGSRFTYALGKLVLWSAMPQYVDSDGTVLKNGDFRYLAIANPKLAPYGVAAREVLQARGLWQKLSKRMVRGENISQVLQFVASGNAELGFVAASQVQRIGRPLAGSFWQVPQTLYTPIEQQAVELRVSEATRAFMSYIKSAEASQIIRDHGYDMPG